MPDHIGERLRHFRQQRGLTVRALASDAVVPVSTISAVETGARPGAGLTLATASRLAWTLGISLDALVYVDPLPPTPRTSVTF